MNIKERLIESLEIMKLLEESRGSKFTYELKGVWSKDEIDSIKNIEEKEFAEYVLMTGLVINGKEVYCLYTGFNKNDIQSHLNLVEGQLTNILVNTLLNYSK